ncbi:major capsid protein [Chitinimonas sp. DQS-5]|uniref:Major capsid protein n=1 Tax=Parachitinimonas caeni TaxID=3031301 RepID=A0ABT7DWQ6_9NEIS|nr:major capsid protein [Parachitinimonas caeni]
MGNDEAYAIPEGVSGLFITRFAPADYLETVNTLGLPYYAKIWPLANDKGLSLEAQSNPPNLCTRPRAVIQLKRGAA